MSDDYTNILLEDIRRQNQAVLEVVGDMQQKVDRIPIIEEKVDQLEKDMKVVKAAAVDLSHQVTDHERFIAHLKAV